MPPYVKKVTFEKSLLKSLLLHFALHLCQYHFVGVCLCVEVLPTLGNSGKQRKFGENFQKKNSF